MRAILVSVDYTDLLAVTLPYNRHHFDQVVIVTSQADYPHVLPVARQHGADVFSTDSFYKDGATFNKWRALEEGLDWMGRTGWLCIMDADVLWPKSICWYSDGGDLFTRAKTVVHADDGYCRLVSGQLCSPLRRMFPDLTQRIPQENEWKDYPVHRNVAEWAGYSQIFHASDPVLGSPPWHETNWKHAGGADSFFQAKWDPKNKIRPPFEVLHLGPAGENWCGRSTAYLGGAMPDKHREKAKKVRQFISSRKRTAKGIDYSGEKL